MKIQKILPVIILWEHLNIHHSTQSYTCRFSIKQIGMRHSPVFFVPLGQRGQSKAFLDAEKRKGQFLEAPLFFTGSSAHADFGCHFASAAYGNFPNAFDPRNETSDPKLNVPRLRKDKRQTNYRQPLFALHGNGSKCRGSLKNPITRSIHES